MNCGRETLTTPSDCSTHDENMQKHSRVHAHQVVPFHVSHHIPLTIVAGHLDGRQLEQCNSWRGPDGQAHR